MDYSWNNLITSPPPQYNSGSVSYNLSGVNTGNNTDELIVCKIPIISSTNQLVQKGNIYYYNVYAYIKTSLMITN